MIRVVETYRDYEDPRALERQLQDFMKKHPNKSEWSDYDYETYYDLKDRINFAWQDEEYDMNIYDESYDKSKYDISFTPEEYKRLQKCVKNNELDSNNDFFGSIETNGYAIDVTCRDYDGVWQADWDTYKLVDKDYNEPLEGGALDISLPYDSQIDFLVKQLKNTTGTYNESYLREYYNQPLHDKLKRDGYTFVGSQGGWYCYAKNALGGGRPTYKAFPTNADSEDAIEDVSYEQVKGKDPMPYDIDAMDYGRGNRGLSYRFAFAESKLTESDFTGDPLLPDVKDVYEELIRMYDVRKDVGYVETAKKMAEYVGGKANVSTSRTSLDNDYMEINWKVYGDFEFDGRKKTSYDGRNSILSDSYGNWLMYIEDLCMAFYKANGGKGGYTPDLIKAIGKGY